MSDERRRTRTRRARGPLTRGLLACVLACVVGRARETIGARDAPNTRDDGAMVLYARAPVVRVGEGTTVGNGMGGRESAMLVRCLAAIASASGRELVLTTAEETPEGGTRAATRFVAPTTAPTTIAPTVPPDLFVYDATSRTYDDSVAYCASLTAHDGRSYAIASIHSAAENAEVVAMITGTAYLGGVESGNPGAPVFVVLGRKHILAQWRDEHERVRRRVAPHRAVRVRCLQHQRPF